MADSLYNYSISERLRLRSLMLKASILEKQGQRGEAILLAQRALEIAEQEKDYSFQARIYGFLSTQYRTIGFLDKGKQSIQKGFDISSNIADKVQVTKYRALVNHEMADYAMEENEYRKAIEYARIAMLLYDKEENENLRHFFLANSNEILGRAYMKLNDEEKGLAYFSKAKTDINNAGAGNTMWAALIYQGYSEALIKNQKLDSVQFYLDKALLISDLGNHGDLKQRVYKSNSDYYKQTNQMDSFSKYDARFNAILKENTARQKAMVNSAYNMLNAKPDTPPKNNKLYIGIAAGVVLLIPLVVFLKRRKAVLAKSKIIPDNEVIDIKKTDLVIPKKIEDEILMKLELFEASKDYLDKNISYPVLIGKLDTNSKYLRKILKKHKKKDYNNYINELRINYIVDKLKTDPKYLSYKISYLADESGFSSHSKFSADFRRIVGQSPSDFIDTVKAFS